MRRAGQTPHGARPNREGFRLRPEAHRLGAPQPPGRSLEPHSNVRPRGMTVLPQGRQNSAYRSGCHKTSFETSQQFLVSGLTPFAHHESGYLTLLESAPLGQPPVTLSTAYPFLARALDTAKTARTGVLWYGRQTACGRFAERFVHHKMPV
jgi:hypothetical protein